ncbi:glucose-6-phosphate isomerase [Mycoplasmopsis hyopharyngis]|uniref:glucose-6-phosphate isomerase n=1 Tax=Mycoplasmopsis hyopharyngis TaxID=29558 RepID=UPI003872F5D8
MKNITFDYSKALTFDEIKTFQNKVNSIHSHLVKKTVVEKEWLGWFDLPEKTDEKLLDSINEAANNLMKQKVEVLVVIGIGGSYLGAKAGYDFIYGPYAPNKPKIELLFAGNDLSAETLINKLKYVEDKRFAINVISKSGTTLEPSIAFREFRKLLESQVGLVKAKNLIIATTDESKGILCEMANQKGYTKFIIPSDVGGRFSVLSPVGLFPLACAGVDIKEMINGARDLNLELQDSDLSKNDAYAYAVSRFILSKKYSVELMVLYEPKVLFFSEWWKQLFGESEGKNNKGLLPANATFSTDLHSLGQMIQEGQKTLFETILKVKEPTSNIFFKTNDVDYDNLKYLDGKSLHEVNNVVYEATLDAHYSVGKVPNLVLTFKNFSTYTLGYLFQFFERALAISAYLLGVNPFNQPGVEIYKNNMLKILKKN